MSVLHENVEAWPGSFAGTLAFRFMFGVNTMCKLKALFNDLCRLLTLLNLTLKQICTNTGWVNDLKVESLR